MANTLINGERGQNVPAADTPEGTPTWGYRLTDGDPKLFNLGPGETLPEGYVDTPAKCGDRPTVVEPAAHEEPPAAPVKSPIRKAPKA